MINGCTGTRGFLPEPLRLLIGALFCKPDATVKRLALTVLAKATSGDSGHACSGSGHSRDDKAVKFSTSTAAAFPTANRRANITFLQRPHGLGSLKSVGAFTLIECLIASGVLAIFVLACISAIMMNEVSVRKAKEEGIAMDFLTKYAETVKALPFTSLAGGTPINVLYNGNNGYPLVAIPTNSNWVAVNTVAYETFYPDLLWIDNRNPQMAVTLTPNTVAGTLHDIEINVKLDWDPPASRGARQEVQIDFLRTKDVTQL